MATLAPSERPLPQTPVEEERETYPTQQQPSSPVVGIPTSQPQSLSAARPQIVSRKPIPFIDGPNVRIQDTPVSPVSIQSPHAAFPEPESASLRAVSVEYAAGQAHNLQQNGPPSLSDSNTSLPVRSTNRLRDESERHSLASSTSIRIEDEHGAEVLRQEQEVNSPGLTYHAFDDIPKSRAQNNRTSHATARSGSSGSLGDLRQPQRMLTPGVDRQRPASSLSPGPDASRGRNLSPLGANTSDPDSLAGFTRDVSSSRRSPSSRPMSYVDLLNNVPYNQQVAPGPVLNNSSLQSVVGSAASLLDTRKTIEMYRANIKKNTDVTVQYEFAIFMVNTARENAESGAESAQMITEAKHILQRLSDRSYPFAQYYLADGYFSGLFNKDKPDHDKAFPLFVAASKHGHAESSYRVALCYEFGWGTTKSYPKAVQFYRTAASKNHPGAATRLGLACINGDMGLGRDKHREGLKWLRRAQESADMQYNAAPYELGLLHLTGYGEVIFKDENYAAQLFTQSAELGHVESNYLMGQAYENGLYGCPRDAALSVHFYNGAATNGHAEAMLALCAWYMVGAQPILEKDEGEAWAWAKQAAELGLPKAEYAVGYFTEMGIGCRRDPLEANVWYVRAADKGNETARQRLAIIRAAAAGADDPAAAGIPMTKAEAKSRDLAVKDKKKFMGIF